MNIIFFHLGEKIALGITIVSVILLIRWFNKRKGSKHKEENSTGSPLIILVILAGVIPLVFISLRQSFSSLGDIPTLPLLAAGSLAQSRRAGLAAEGRAARA